MTPRRTLLAVVLTAVSAGAWAGPAVATTTPTEPPATTDPAPTTEAPPTTAAGPATMPLTGVVLTGDETVPRRGAITVKIDNADGARPQSGLNFADVVFEEIVEGDITRFAAVFHSQGANPVGPIRSGRTQDVDLLSSLGSPLFVWSGGNGGVTRAINESNFVSIPDGTADFFYRSDERERPHNLYSNTDPIWAHYTWSIYPPPPLFQYVAPGAAVPGEPASFVELMMGGIPVRWEYDAATGLYARSQLGRVHQLEEGPATADNVVIMLCDYGISSADPRSPEAQTVGNGIAFVLSDGTLQIGTWSRPLNTSPIALADATGAPILIGPGRTWVELANAQTHETVTGNDQGEGVTPVTLVTAPVTESTGG